jgi:hypothetical protein
MDRPPYPAGSIRPSLVARGAWAMVYFAGGANLFNSARESWPNSSYQFGGVFEGLMFSGGLAASQ